MKDICDLTRIALIKDKKYRIKANRRTQIGLTYSREAARSRVVT